MKHEPSRERAGDDAQSLAKRTEWFATFTLLDLSGAIGSPQVRRVGAAIMRILKLIGQSTSDRSKSRVFGV